MLVGTSLWGRWPWIPAPWFSSRVDNYVWGKRRRLTPLASSDNRDFTEHFFNLFAPSFSFFSLFLVPFFFPFNLGIVPFLEINNVQSFILNPPFLSNLNIPVKINISIQSSTLAIETKPNYLPHSRQTGSCGVQQDLFEKIPIPNSKFSKFPGLWFFQGLQIQKGVEYTPLTLAF